MPTGPSPKDLSGFVVFCRLFDSDSMSSSFLRVRFKLSFGNKLASFSLQNRLGFLSKGVTKFPNAPILIQSVTHSNPVDPLTGPQCKQAIRTEPRSAGTVKPDPNHSSRRARSPQEYLPRPDSMVERLINMLTVLPPVTRKPSPSPR
jgi:hypothetical protein